MTTAHWIDAIEEDFVPEDDVIGLQVGSLDIALYKVAGQVFVTDNTCTHGHGRLCDGFLEGYDIECPLHQGKFDIRTGHATCPPVTQALRSYPVRIEGGRVFVQVVE
jgi:naphthalene 1,2-dioxygenase ferredoxin component